MGQQEVIKALLADGWEEFGASADRSYKFAGPLVQKPRIVKAGGRPRFTLKGHPDFRVVVGPRSTNFYRVADLPQPKYEAQRPGALPQKVTREATDFVDFPTKDLAAILEHARKVKEAHRPPAMKNRTGCSSCFTAWDRGRHE